MALVTACLALGELLERLHRGGRAEAVGAQVAGVLGVGLLVSADGLYRKDQQSAYVYVYILNTWWREGGEMEVGPTLLVNVAVGQMALLLADGVDDVGEDLAVAGRASILRGLLVSSAQLLVFVVEVAAGRIVTTVGICI